MRSIADTMKRLAAQQTRRLGASGPVASHLSEVREFGSNPGALRGHYFAPDVSSESPALVVALHGCTQNATGFDQGTGWSGLAQRYGFAVLLPEQTRRNSINLCFNWYDAADNRRDVGEALSICQMIEAMIVRHGVDRTRIFVTGLSAGGAMAAVMLATYPEIFAGGAIVAGLPYGSANNVTEAFDRMRGHGGPSAADLAKAVRNASAHRERWPSIAVWHGTTDAIVDVSNARTAIEQWLHVHDARAEPAHVEQAGGVSHRVWRDGAGRPIVEEYLIMGMGHGEPLSGAGGDACGAPGPYMLDVGISAARTMAAAWGLIGRSVHARLPPSAVVSVTHHQDPVNVDRQDIGRVIEDALRSAGLMR